MTGEKGENCERRKNQAILDSFLYPLLYILEGGLKISQKNWGPLNVERGKGLCLIWQQNPFLVWMVLGPDQSGKPCDSQKGSFGSYTSHPDDDDDDVDNDDDNVDQRNNYQHLISSKASQNQKLRDISSHFFYFED